MFAVLERDTYAQICILLSRITAASSPCLTFTHHFFTTRAPAGHRRVYRTVRGGAVQDRLRAQSVRQVPAAGHRQQLQLKDKTRIRAASPEHSFAKLRWTLFITR